QDLSSTQIYCGTQQDNTVSQEDTRYENGSGINIEQIRHVDEATLTEWVQVAKHDLKAMRLQERLKDDKQ
ncbi:13159_t:CDS:2, partial [Dentiscutata heterogama]